MTIQNARRHSIREMVEEAWRTLARLTPEQAREAQSHGALLVDVRDSAQRARDGAVPEALEVGLNVLEWRFDPDEPGRVPAARDLDVQIILMCHEGYSSALAAMRLRELGYRNATDVMGGFVAWRALGLPIQAR